jgi:hypothetical protein
MERRFEPGIPFECGSVVQLERTPGYEPGNWGSNPHGATIAASLNRVGSVTEQHGSVRSYKSGFDSRPARQPLGCETGAVQIQNERRFATFYGKWSIRPVSGDL